MLRWVADGWLGRWGPIAQMLELTHAEVTAAVGGAVREACCSYDQPEPNLYSGPDFSAGADQGLKEQREAAR